MRKKLLFLILVLGLIVSAIKAEWFIHLPSGLTIPAKSIKIRTNAQDPSSVNTLSGLTTTAGAISPVFAASTLSYQVGPLPSTTAAVTVTPTVTDATANVKVQINGGTLTTVTSGSPSDALTLNTGTNTINIVVTAEDGTPKTYVLTVFKAYTLDNAGLTAATPSAVAFSLRKLSSTYTGPIIRVRAGTTNAEADVAFDAAGTLSGTSMVTVTTAGTSGFSIGQTMTFTTFFGAQSVFVTTWYDQSGLGRNLSQATTTKQPSIVTAGVINVLQNKPALVFGSNNLASAATVMFTSGASMVGIAKGTSTTPGSLVTKANSNLPAPFDYTNTVGDFYTGNGAGSYTPMNLSNTGIRSDISSNVGAAVYSFTIPTTGTANNYLNGTLTNSSTIAGFGDKGNSLMIGNRNDNGGSGNFYIPEIILFNSALSTTDRNTIENNQKTNYSILSADTYLSGLTMSSGSITGFNGATLSYTVNVLPSLNSIIVKPKLSDPNASAKIKINAGTYSAINSSSDSDPLPLNSGSNTINIMVTAQNGVNNKTYTLTVVKSVVRYVREGGAGTKDGSSWANASDDLQLMINNSDTNEQVWVAKGTYKPNRKLGDVNTVTPNDRNNAFVMKANVQVYGGFDPDNGIANLGDTRLFSTTSGSILTGDFNGNDVVSGEGGALSITGNGEDAYHVVVCSGGLGTSVLDGFTITGGYANGVQYSQTTYGGGIYLTNAYLNLNNLIVYGNMGSYGGGIGSSGSSSAVLNYVTVKQNYGSDFGGGVSSPGGGNLNIRNSIISGNKSPYGGGLASSNNSNWTMTNVLIINNNASSTYGSGGGIGSSNYSSWTITNITMANNTANGSSSGAISNGNNATISFRNSIILGGVSNGNDGVVSYKNSLLEGSTSTANGNISAAGQNTTTLFQSAANNNYRLTNNSIAVNSGSNAYYDAAASPNLSGITTDLSGFKRISGTIDLGAYENQESGAALHFDGNNDAVRVEPSTIFDQPELTLEAWIKPERLNGNAQTIMASRTLDDTRFSFLMNNSTIGLWNGNTASSVNLSSPFVPNHWYHVAMVIKAASSDVYLNGIFIGSTSNGMGNKTNLPFQIGNAHPNGGFETFKGTIDEVKVWKGQRTAAEIAASYNIPIADPGSQYNLLAYFNFNEGVAEGDNSAITQVINNGSSGIAAANLVNMARTGSSSNWVESFAMVMPMNVKVANPGAKKVTVSWQHGYMNPLEKYAVEVAKDNAFTQPVSDSPFLTDAANTSKVISGLDPNTTYYVRMRAEKTSVTGQGMYTQVQSISTTSELVPPGSALNFDGSNDYVTTEKLTSTISGNYTVMLWVRPTHATKNMHLFSTREGGENSFDIGLIGGTKVHADIGNGSSWLSTAADVSYSYAVNKWMHIAYVVSPTGYKIYINGKQMGSGTLTGTPMLFNSARYMVLGKNLTENTYFNGNMDEVKVFDAALTDAQVATEMLGDDATAAANRKVYFDFDAAVNSQNTMLYDVTNNGFDGTLKNFALNGSTSNWVESYARVIPLVNAITNLTNTGFTINWTAPTIGTVDNGYQLEVSTNASFTAPITGSPFTVNDTKKDLSGLGPNKTYYYRIAADKTSVTGQGATLAPQLVKMYTPPGNALKFDGTDDYISLGNSTVFKPTAQLSVGVWVNRANWATATFQTIISNTEGGGYSLNISNAAVSNTGTLITSLVNRNSAYATLTYDAANLTAGWHYIALTYGGRVATLYVDGLSVATNDAGNTYPISYHASNSTLIGAEAGAADAAASGRYFSGTLDELRIYNTALTQSELNADMLSTTSVKSVNLVAQYDFDQSTTDANTELIDASGNGNTKVLRNFNFNATSNWVESYAMVVPVTTAASGVDKTKFTANWTAPSIGTVDNGYKLDVSTNAGFTAPVIGSPFTVSGLNQEITGLSAATTYYYRVRADKTSVTGLGAPSATITVTTSKLDQVITFPAFTPKGPTSADFLPGATTDSGLPLTYTSSNTAVAEVYQDAGDGNKWKIKIKGLGTTDITANQAGNSTYNPASFLRELSVTSATLPVSFISFDAKIVNGASQLSWQTASEVNNKSFLIYRSGDNKVFTYLGEVAGMGNSSTPKNYTLYDRNPLNGNNYYRLIQVDNNGTQTNLGERALNFKLSAQEVIAYPNPSTDQVNLNFEAGEYHTLELIDFSGKVLEKRVIGNGDTTLVISLLKYPAGTYLVRISGKLFTVKKIIKQ